MIAADDLEVTCPHSEGTGAGGRDTLPEMRRKGVIWTAQEFYQKAFELKNI